MSTDQHHRPNPRVWNRRLHRWGALAIALPFLVVVLTGLLLQTKKQVPWVQPPERTTEAREPSVPYDVLMERARAVPEAGITGWEDVDKLDVRPGKGMLKLIGKNRWELQMDIATGEVLQVAYRRSDFIETLHDMSWIHGSAKLWLGVPVGLVVLGLWVTGMYMWWVHNRAKRRHRIPPQPRRTVGAATLAWFLSAGALAAQQVPDTTFRPVVSPAAFAAGAGPLVLIDEGHFNFHTVTGRYAPFAALLRRDGFRVAAHAGRFTAASLREAGILVIANALGDDGPWTLPARPAFTAEEIEVVRRWVEGGGRLLLIADHMPFPGSNEALGRAFGIEMTDGFAMTSPTERGIFRMRRGVGGLADGPAANGRGPADRVDSVTVFTGAAFRLVGPGQPVLTIGAGVRNYLPTVAWEFTDQTPAPDAAGMLMGALLRRGAGRVAVFGEAAMFSAQRAGPRAEPMGFNAPEAPRNAQFALNVLHWLAGLTDGA